MKILTNKAFYLALFTLIGLACEEDTVMDYNSATPRNQGITDPYLQIQTPVIGFQAGTENYPFAVNVINPDNELRLDQVKVYSIYTSAATGNQSNEALLGTLDVEGVNRNIIEGTWDYSQLKAGITVDGAPLPDDQVALTVGSGWRLRFEGVTTSGETVRLKGNINVAVLSRFAGIYQVTKSEYYRIGVLTATWTGSTRFIGSVDEDTFSYNDYWGSFAWTGNQFNFDIDFTTNKIKVPIIVDGLFSGNRALDCDVEPQTFSVFTCTNTNVLVPNETTGEHVIKLTYGYFTDGSGPREFSEELKKVVD